MDIEWKIFSLSMIISIVITATCGLVLSTIIYPEIPWEEIFQSPQGALTIAQGTGGFNIHYLPLSVLIILALICISVFTVFFYFILRYLNKQKKQEK